MPAVLIGATGEGGGDRVRDALSTVSLALGLGPADTAASTSASEAGGGTDGGGDVRSAVRVVPCACDSAERVAGSSVVYAGGSTYGGGGGGAARCKEVLRARVEFHIGSGCTAKGRSRCNWREEPGMRANASPVNCGEGGGLGARSVVVGDDGGSCNSRAGVVVVVVADGSPAGNSAGASGGLDALPEGGDAIILLERVSALGRGAGGGGLR
jgi:hypothetical protein